MRRKQTTITLINARPLVVERRTVPDLLDEAEELAAVFEAAVQPRRERRAA